MQPREIAFPKSFAAIVSFSLFSHLPRHRFAEFLEVLYRQLEPGGLMLFTTISPFGTAAENRDASGFTYLTESGIPHLDPDEYGATFADPTVVHALCEQVGIRHVWHLERELWRIQDVYVIAKEDIPGMERWTRTPLARGAILRSEIAASGLARAEGYLRIPCDAPALREVHIVVDRETWIPCAFRDHPGPLPESEGGRFFRQVDWYVEGGASEWLEGVHSVAAVATLENGARNCFDVSLLALRNRVP